MDRRTFLKSTGAVAAAGTGATAAADAKPPAWPALVNGARELVLVTAWSLDTPSYGDSVLRLAHRVEIATEGRYRIVHKDVRPDGLAAVATGAADIYHGSEHLNLDVEPALAYFAGVPGPLGLDAQDFQAWLIAGGGQMLWNDLAACLGARPLMAGHTGNGNGLWLKQPLAASGDLRELRLNLFGLSGQVLQRLGGVSSALPPAEIGPALADGRLDGAEWAGPMASMALGLHNAARHVMPRGISPGGSTWSLGMRRELWETLTTSDQAIFEACAAEETRITLAEANAHRRMAWRVLAERHGVAVDVRRVRHSDALVRATEETLAAVGSSSARARRIDASYRSFADLARRRRRARATGPIA